MSTILTSAYVGAMRFRVATVERTKPSYYLTVRHDSDRSVIWLHPAGKSEAHAIRQFNRACDRAEIALLRAEPD